MIAKIADARLLWLWFAITCALSVGFAVISQVYGFRLLDGMADPGKVLAYVGTLTNEQKFVHTLTTATLDVLYPVTYAALFAGLTARYYNAGLPYLFIPAALVVPVDLIEGVIQIIILNGGIGLIGWKFWFTLFKFILFFIAFAIAIVGLGQAIFTSVLARIRK